MADSFHFFADAIEQGTAPLVVAQASLKVSTGEWISASERGGKGVERYGERGRECGGYSEKGEGLERYRERAREWNTTGRGEGSGALRGESRGVRGYGERAGGNTREGVRLAAHADLVTT
eukprot:2306062-Prymnesium_polylepis.1